MRKPRAKKERKHNLKLVGRVFVPLLSFEMLYSLGIKYLIVPFFGWMYHGLLKLCQIPYLSVSNILQAITNPILDVGLLLIILMAGYFLNLEISAIVFCLSEAHQGRKCTLYSILRFSFPKTLRILLPSSIPLLLFSLVLIPISPLSFTTSSLGQLAVPKFITSAIDTPLLVVLYGAFIAMILILSVIGFFTYHVFFLEGKKVPSAFKTSAALMKGRYARTTWGLIISQLRGLLIPVLFLILIAAGMVLYAVGNEYEPSSYYGIYLGLKSTFMLLVTRVPVIMGYAWLTFSYLGPIQPKEKTKFSLKGSIPFIILLALTVTSLFISCIKSAEKAKFDDPNPNIEVISHRGVSEEAPENTLPAYELAWLYNAPWAETDVQLTKDGKLLLYHDNTLTRMIGLPKRPCDATLDEVRSYEIVDCPGQYRGMTLSTLDELLDQCNGKIKLLIELKTQGGDDQLLAQKVSDLIVAKGFEGQCAIHAESLEALYAFRKLNPIIPIGWCTPMVQGELQDIDVDFFSLEQTYLEQLEIDLIHQFGKKVYAWTVNDILDMRQCIDERVDGIITDEVTDALEITRASSIVDGFIHDLLNDQIDWNHVDY